MSHLAVTLIKAERNSDINVLSVNGEEQERVTSESLSKIGQSVQEL